MLPNFPPSGKENCLADYSFKLLPASLMLARRVLQAGRVDNWLVTSFTIIPSTMARLWRMAQLWRGGSVACEEIPLCWLTFSPFVKYGNH